MGKRLFKVLTAVAALALTAYLVPKKNPEASQRPVPLGESLSYLSEKSGENSEPIPLYYYRPSAFDETRPVVIAFHGFGRKGEEFRKELESFADENNIMIVCPEFSKKKYPGARCYQEGNVSDKDGTGGHIHPKDEWIFSAADRIVEEVKRRVMMKGKIIVFGHSAGGQFLQRRSLLSGPAKEDVTAIANAGWFTMIDRNVPYPYGIADIEISDKELAKVFAKPLIFFVGSADVKRDYPFRDTEEADAQGLTRKERGENYYRKSKEKAEEMKTPFRWKLETVDGAAHEEVKMAKAAIRYILNQ